jgi:hypothetical protein
MSIAGAATANNAPAGGRIRLEGVESGSSKVTIAGPMVYDTGAELGRGGPGENLRYWRNGTCIHVLHARPWLEWYEGRHGFVQPLDLADGSQNEVIGAYIVQLAYKRMIQRRNGSCLLLEPLAVLFLKA